MAFSDPQSVTIATVATSLPRVSSGVNSGIFSTPDGLVKLTISHVYGKRTRSSIRLDFAKVAPDPLISAQNIKYSMSAYLVVDTPVTGYTVADAVSNVKALADYLSASTNARVTQLMGGEN